MAGILLRGTTQNNTFNLQPNLKKVKTLFPTRMEGDLHRQTGELSNLNQQLQCTGEF